MKLPISVFIITKNESKYLAQTLESVKFCDEVIVVDSGSDDGTVEIAERMGAKVYHQDWLGYARQKQYALSLCSHEWALNLDGDETVSPALAKRISELVTENKYDAVRIDRNDHFIGKPFPDSIKKPSNVRLFKKAKAHYSEERQVHESARIDGSTYHLHEAFDHYGYGDIEVLTNKYNLYSGLKAGEKFQRNKAYSLLKLMLIFPITFVKKYLIQKYFLAGARGFILSVLDAHYAFLKEAKLYELHELKKLEKKN